MKDYNIIRQVQPLIDSSQFDQALIYIITVGRWSELRAISFVWKEIVKVEHGLKIDEEYNANILLEFSFFGDVYCFDVQCRPCSQEKYTVTALVNGVETCDLYSSPIPTNQSEQQLSINIEGAAMPMVKKYFYELAKQKLKQTFESA